MVWNCWARWRWAIRRIPPSRRATARALTGPAARRNWSSIAADGGAGRGPLASDLLVQRVRLGHRRLAREVPAQIGESFAAALPEWRVERFSPCQDEIGSPQHLSHAYEIGRVTHDGELDQPSRSRFHRQH